ncbi:MAG: TRAP transporter substrate-binding protein [Spirochaetae bacterium HGW-Spirochaetae-7]|nr:MAG: TRAP transporter substrate-binding protein [Spirochaetae bacterium HGW-Spirochaetae-7]
MGKYKKALLVLLFLCAIVGMLSATGTKDAVGNAPAQGSQDEIKPATYTWIAGGMGGGWYTMAGGFARLVNEKEPKITIKVIPGGGVANPSQLSNGDADFAWGVGYVDKAAYSGLAPIYDKPYKNINSFAGTMAVDYYHFLAAKDQGVTKFEELIAKIKAGEKVKIAAPMTGTSDFVMTSFVLKFYGVTYDMIKANGGTVMQAVYGDIPSLFKDRHVDYAFATLGLPGAIMTEMTVSRPSVLMAISDEVIDYCATTYGTVARASGLAKVPGGTYPGMPDAIQTLCHSTELLVSPNVPANVVYAITKILNENKEFLLQFGAGYKAFDPKTAGKTVQVPLHPGAAKYYKEVGNL